MVKMRTDIFFMTTGLAKASDLCNFLPAINYYIID